MKDLLTIRKYEFKDGTVLYVEINRAAGTVSFVEPIGNLNKEYKPKKWLFADRTLDYMNGWLNILKCMEFAIKDARDDLDAYQSIEDDKLIDTFLVADEEKKQ